MDATTRHQMTVEADRARLEDTCQMLGASEGLNTVCINDITHRPGFHFFVPSHNLSGIDADGQPVYTTR